MIEWATEIRAVTEMKEARPGEYKRLQRAAVYPTLAEVGVSKTDSVPLAEARRCA